MATELDFITPAGLNILTTANVVGNTVSLDMFSNTPRAQTFPVYSQNFAMNPRLGPGWEPIRLTTGSYMASNGLISYASANTPRFDYDPVTLQCKGLLTEEGRVNQIYSSSFVGNSAASWGYYDGIDNNHCEMVPNAGIAPDGTQTACFFRHTTATTTYYVMYPNVQGPLYNNVTYTYSVFVNSNTASNGEREPSFTLGIYDGTDNNNCIYFVFNTDSNGQLTTWANYGTSANVQVHSLGTQVYPKGWVRFYYTFRFTSGNRAYVQMKHELVSAGLTNASIKTRGVYFWGPQLEQGPFPTSYIPTPFNATATRTQDYMVFRGNKLNDFKDGGVMTIADTTAPLGYHGNTAMVASSEQRYTAIWQLLSLPAPPGPFVPPIDRPSFENQGTWHNVLNDGGTPHNVQHYTSMFNNIENYIGFNSIPISVNNYISNASYVSTAVVLRSNNWVMAVNGAISGTSLNYFAGANNNYLQLGPMNGYFKRLAIYNQQLSNTELINITTK